ncbi:MAG: nitrous oxide reductase accessory protein NosL [Ardenticatenaceae bacterium]|nr:nitrous oxide reductase accessory protein NosL [Ardenticatenaceae bacterium]
MRKVTLLALTMMLFLAACGASSNLDEPPDILYGQDVCDECGMIINEARFAASYVTTTGVVRRFDDIGNMLLYDAKHQEDVHVYWVHDFHSQAWINAEKATLVLNPDLVTPMGWSLAAFAQATAADVYVAEFGGTVSTLAALQQAVAAGAVEPALLRSHTHEQGEGVEPELGMSHEHD